MKKSQAQSTKKLKEYCFSEFEGEDAHAYLNSKIILVIERLSSSNRLPRSIFDLGCGNGSLLSEFNRLGWKTKGVDISESGLAYARKFFPHVEIEYGSVYENLTLKYNQFPFVISCEVIEHLYDPRSFVENLYKLTLPGGFAVVSTPYHGYLKNLALAASGKMDAHFTALWDHGHIKFFSKKTLKSILMESGFEVLDFTYAGRIPPFQKSMIAICRKPI